MYNMYTVIGDAAASLFSFCAHFVTSGSRRAVRDEDVEVHTAVPGLHIKFGIY